MDSYSDYWNCVIGSGRTPAQAVEEFDLLAMGDRRELDEWLTDAEEIAAVELASAHEDADEIMDGWRDAGHHETCIDELMAAAAEGAQ